VPEIPPAPEDGLVRVTAVSGKGKGEGNLSTEREWGLVKGPVVMGLLLPREPFKRFSPRSARGVGGEEVPTLFRSFRETERLALRLIDVVNEN
jgi:hypothetical protein